MNRTFFLDPNLNTPHFPCCGVCGKKVYNAKHFVWSADYFLAVHPDDVDDYNIEHGAKSGVCQKIPIGKNCTNKIPKEFLVK